MTSMKNTDNLTPVDRIRTEKKISRLELSRRSGVKLRTLEEWSARRNTNPTAKQLYAVAQVLGCTMDELVEPELWKKE